MDNYIVSARKYRPMTFDSVVGQSSLTVTLKNAIKSGRLAHAYLFCGPRGVGKTTCARIFAKTINCLSPAADGEACGECESCKAFSEQRSFNIHELDAASNNSVEDIRQLIEQVRIPPQIGKYKVFIIDEVHMLSQAAFNAFLKTLEEPPHHAIFILATTEKHKLLPTILSRCQIYDFSRMSIDNIVNHLQNVANKEGITCEPAALNVIAQKADGGMRDALSIFDQVASFCNGNITYQQTIANLNVLDYEYYFRLTDYFLETKITECMLTFNEILSKGFEGQHFITGLSSHFRNLLVSRDAQTVNLIEASEEVRNKYREQAQKCQPKFLYSAMKLANTCDLNYKQSQNKRLLVELTLIEIAQLSSDDGASSGHGPYKILKPIFKKAAAAKAAAGNAAQGQQQAQQPQQSTGQSAYNQYLAEKKQETAQAPQRPLFSQGTPAQPINRRPLQRFSISQAGQHNTMQQNVPQTPHQTVAAAHVPHTFEDKPIDEISLIREWRTFAQSLPKDDTGLAMHMDHIEPKLLDDHTTCEVLADNPTIKTQLERNAGKVESYLRSKLQNSKVKMTIRMREIAERPKIYNKVEQLNIMCQQSEALQKLRKELELELC